MMRGRPWRWLVLSLAIVTGGAMGATAASAQPAAPAASYAQSTAKSQACITGHLLCTEVQDYEAAFHGAYVGHDEPSVLYYSNVPGAGNRNQWQVTLPRTRRRR